MNSQQLQLVTFEQAKRLKAAGFDWQCTDYYVDGGALATRMSPHDFNDDDDIYGADCSSPSVALALKWMRDVKKFRYSLAIIAHGHYFRVVENEVIGNAVRPSERIKLAKTYDEAESALLDELQTLLENGN